MKTLITGASGFIGHRLGERLTSDGRSIRCFVRAMSDTSRLLNRPNVEILVGELSAGASVRDAVRGADVVYHLAVDYSHPGIDDVRLLVDSCMNTGIKRFIYLSSISAVGLSNASGTITESTPPLPDTEYGSQKLAAERLLLEAHASHGFPVVIVRPTSVYGVGEVNFWLPLFQAIYSGRLKHLFGDGTNLLSLCYIDNLVDGVLLAETSSTAVGQVYIISDDRPYRFKDVVATIGDACGATFPRSTIPAPLAPAVAQLLEYSWRLQLTEPIVPFLPGNVARWTAHYPCSIAKARAELGFEPRVDLAEGVRRTVSWYRQNGYLYQSVPWEDGALDWNSLPIPPGTWPQTAERAVGRAARLAWNVAALGWRLPPKVVRRVRRMVLTRP